MAMSLLYSLVESHGYMSKYEVSGVMYWGERERDWYSLPTSRPFTSFRIFGGSPSRTISCFQLMTNLKHVDLARMM